MKRDFDLIRKIMADTESIPAGELRQKFEYPGYDSMTVDYHVALLIEAGLINGSKHDRSAGKITVVVNDLTWAGHDFLDAMKDDNLWNKAKEHVLKPGASFTFSLLLQWLEIKAKEKLGLP